MSEEEQVTEEPVIHRRDYTAIELQTLRLVQPEEEVMGIPFTQEERDQAEVQATITALIEEDQMDHQE